MKSKFWNIFKDDNVYNEKSIVGFMSFAIMVIYAFLHLVAPLFGKTIEINEMIYDSFVSVTLGSFGIAAAGKAIESFSEPRTAKNLPDRNRKVDQTQEEVDEYLKTE